MINKSAQVAADALLSERSIMRGNGVKETRLNFSTVIDFSLRLMSVNQTLIQTRHNASHYAAVTLMQGERIIYTEVPEKEHTKFLEGLDIRVAALLFKAAIANDWKPALVPTEEPLFVPWPED